MITITNDLMNEIRVKQESDQYLVNERELITQGNITDFREGSDGILRF